MILLQQREDDEHGKITESTLERLDTFRLEFQVDAVGDVHHWDHANHRKRHEEPHLLKTHNSYRSIGSIGVIEKNF